MNSAIKSEPLFVVPVFVPHSGCPHRCAFCNQVNITGAPRRVVSSETVQREIRTFLGYNKTPDARIQIAFYGGNFLGMPPKEIERLLETAETFIQQGQAHGLRFSTRPDTITQTAMNIIRPFSVSTIEIGAQSMDNTVLHLARRGHRAEDTIKAAKCVQQYGYETGLQMMTGLPGDTSETVRDTGEQIARLNPDFVRIYPTVVLNRSPLARMYRQGDYTPWSMEKTITAVKRLYLLFRSKGINVIRMGLQSDQDLEKDTTILAGPYHPAFGQLVWSRIYRDMAVKLIGDTPRLAADALLDIHVHPGQTSTMRGQKNVNMMYLRSHYPGHEFTVSPDREMEKDTLEINHARISMTALWAHPEYRG